MKIAFTSCCDPHNDAVQTAWTYLTAQNPHVLILLGDNIYMDYGLGSNPKKNKEPQQLSLDQFSALMHANYSKQWAVKNFHDAILKIPKIYAIWDDHDFSWNNGRGAGIDDESKEFVSEQTRKLSRALFEQFRSALKDKLETYPANLYPTGIIETDFGGIQQTVKLADDLSLHLLDGRSYRPNKDRSKSLLGDEQQSNLEIALSKPNVINLIASGTTLKDWKNFKDYKWLRNLSKNRKLVVLSGDIHEPDIREHDRIYEFTASAMAQPARITSIFGKESNVFGILDIEGNTMKVNIYQEQHLCETASVDLATWKLSM